MRKESIVSQFIDSSSVSWSAMKAVSLGVLLVVLTGAAYAQQRTARPDRGFGGNGGYQTTEIDSVSLQNGGVSVQIPLASLPPMAGGKLGYTLNATYNSKLFEMTRKEVRIPPGGPPGCPVSYSTQEMVSSGGGSGWKIGAEYEIFFRDANEDYDYIEPDLSTCYGDEWYHMMGLFFKPMIRMPDGSEHALLIDGSFPAYSGTRDHLKGYYLYGGSGNQPQFTAPVRFYTIDGSFLTIIYKPASDPVRWILYMKDGTTVQQSDVGQKIIDKNGNSILQGYRAAGNVYEQFVKDEHTGREIKWSATTYNGNSNATKVEYQSVGGTWQQVIIVNGTTTVLGKVYGRTDWNPTGGELHQGDTYYVSQQLPATGFSVIREIIFPATEQGVAPQKFVFGYNSDVLSQGGTASFGWGQLSDITTPTQAHIKYNYRHDGIHAFSASGIYDEDDVLKDFITSKVVTHDGDTDTWSYQIDNTVGSSPSIGHVINPDGTSYKEIYNPTNSAYAGFGGQSGFAGRQVRTISSSGVMVERKWKALGGVVNLGAAGDSTAVNAVVEAEYTSLLDIAGNRIKMSAKKYQHDFNGEVTQVIEYDWFDPGTVSYTSTY